MKQLEKIEALTPAQEKAMELIAADYEKMALGGDDSYDPDLIRQGIDFVYAMTDLKSPEIVICPSPADMAAEAKLTKGEFIDYMGCGFDSGWTAFYEFMQQIGVQFDADWNFDKWRDFVKKSGVFATVLRENVAYVCIRPCEVNRTAEGNLHNEKGPAIAWRDGYCEYALNGVMVDEALVMTPAEKLDPALILKEQNAEVRREIVRKVGIERVIAKLGAETIDKQGDYELVLLDLQDGRKREFLKMKNPSIGVWHIEGVEPGIRTVAAALAWRNGIDTPPAVLT